MKVICQSFVLLITGIKVKVKLHEIKMTSFIELVHIEVYSEGFVDGSLIK